MNGGFAPPVTPRNGHTLQVLIIARISTVHQDARSLEDQAALCERYVCDRYGERVEIRVIQGRGSGEILDRQELAEAEAAVESRRYDLVIVEDLGRICRRNRAVDFCELCEDAETRLIAINDSIDTARDEWRMNAFFASFKHESGNKDTSRRIRRSLRNRFEQGGVVQTFQYGYVKPDGCTDDSQVRKDPAAETVYDQWFTKLDEGANFAEVADWLNELGIPPGPYCRSKRWSSFMVGRMTRNPIVKGLRTRNKKISKRINKTGRRHSVNAPPEELLERHCPHLTFIEPERFDRVNRLLEERNAGYRRSRRTGMDPLRGVPKSRTPWPAQHLCCGVCGRLYYRGGHGRTAYLMCAGSREHKCWNGVTFEGGFAAQRLAHAILEEIEALPEFDATFLNDLRRQLDDQESERRRRLRKLDDRRGDLERSRSNILEAIRQAGTKSYLIEEADKIQVEFDAMQREREDVARAIGAVVTLPSVERIKAEARNAMTGLATESPEFARLMRLLVPKLLVKPYQLIDGGKVVLRAHLTLNLAPLSTASGRGSALDGLLERELVVDLFAQPQRVEHRQRVVAMTAARVKQRDIGTALGITQPAVQRALGLAREMERLDVSDPYQLVREPPEESGKLRRHRHRRYRFEPLPGFPTF